MGTSEKSSWATALMVKESMVPRTIGQFANLLAKADAGAVIAEGVDTHRLPL